MKALIIIAQTGYQDIELQGTRDALKDAQFEIVLASHEKGPCTGKFGGREQAALALREVQVSDYDRIAFIGGPGAHVLKDDPDALRIAQEAEVAGMIFGAICIAPTVLAVAGVLKGKKATVWNEDNQQKACIESYGAIYTGDPVTIDGNIITGNGPKAAEEFGKELAKSR